ncbi:interleukin-3 receptor subunit alpha isoform X2 [Saccopteryx bilineata]|uniref:interleukin-3 receptor subunit alpha isoform X2 n=1 Tax=Saccopteryx bilineata TaxID=59482 RepID=UPI00338D7468
MLDSSSPPPARGGHLPMALLSLALLLTSAPASRLPHTDHDPHPPMTNLRMEPGTRRLTWDLRGDVSNISCTKLGFHTKAKKGRYCQFFVLDKCATSNYTVKGTLVNGTPFSSWIQYPKQAGNPGAAAQGLRCQAHDRDFLTCRWEVGREAPSDVQYFFYLQEVSSHKKWECPRYTADALGTHTQCQFDDLSEFPDQQYHFVVNGTSGGYTIPCNELITSFSDIEILSAPALTANCNESLSVLTWEMSSRYHRNFDYELEIQQLSKMSFLLLNPGTFTVRIRASTYRTVGQWSVPQHFVCDREKGARLHVWLTASLIALAALLTVVPAVLLCRRYLRKLFPPIPHMKDPMGDNFPTEKMTLWEASSSPTQDCPVAEVQVVRAP